MRALITGVGGFAGSHLADYLTTNTDLEVYGVDRPGVEHAGPSKRVEFLSGDLCNPEAVMQIVRQVQPDYIFHLAAQAFVPLSWHDPWATLENNIRSQLNVLEATIELGSHTRILVIGSADEYGLVAPDELPIRETNPLRPYSPYAVSKIAQDLLGYQYFVSHKLHIVRVRPFNHIGPRQKPAFVVAAFAKQIAEAEVGLIEPIVRVGNLRAKRDFSDVRDMVRGYYLTLQHGEPGEVYNLGSQQAYGIGEILDTLVGMSQVPLEIQPDPARLRPSDVPVVVGDCSKVREHTGWQVQIPLEQSLRDVLEYWREQVTQRQGAPGNGGD